MHRGFTKRHRKRWDKGYHTDRLLWVMMDYFIDFANWQDREFYHRRSGKIITVKRGQHIYGELKLAKFFKVSRKRIRKRLQILENIGFLHIQRDNRFSMATVLNYDKYNPIEKEKGPPKGQHRDSTGTAEGTQPKHYKKLKEEYGPEFLKFWDAYPKKRSKGSAYKAWKKLNGQRPDTKILIEKIKELARLPEWEKDSGQFIPHPATWLNARGWEDETETPPPAPDNHTPVLSRAEIERETSRNA